MTNWNWKTGSYFPHLWKEKKCRSNYLIELFYVKHVCILKHLGCNMYVKFLEWFLGPEDISCHYFSTWVIRMNEPKFYIYLYLTNTVSSSILELLSALSGTCQALTVRQYCWFHYYLPLPFFLYVGVHLWHPFSNLNFHQGSIMIFLWFYETLLPISVFLL